VLAHAGEALDSRKAFEALPDYDKDSLIEFLKSLQVLPPGTRDLIVDENFKPKVWSDARKQPPARVSQSMKGNSHHD
jgi:Predicted thiol oxidoreductase